jgi:hypothetical protein
MTELLMPDLVSPYAGFRHSHRSAIESLRALGIEDSRIRIRMAGAVGARGMIVAQDPAPAEPIHENVTLTVAGRGIFHHLPYGMRLSGGGFGLRDLAGLFDDPHEKARLQVAEGVRLFAIGPDADEACSRWIRLFGQDAERWPPEKRHNVAILLASLQRLAGTEDGIRQGLQVLLGLPLLEIRQASCYLPLPGDLVLRPGKSALQLGVNTFLSDRLAAPAELQLVLGPVTLEVFEHFQTQAGRKMIAQALELLAPLDRKCSIHWSVLDRSKAPRLGDPAGNSRLGVNTHLGQSGQNT